MSRLHIPTVEQSPDASKPLLDAVKKQLGVVPNLMKLVGKGNIPETIPETLVDYGLRTGNTELLTMLPKHLPLASLPGNLLIRYAEFAFSAGSPTIAASLRTN